MTSQPDNASFAMSGTETDDAGDSTSHSAPANQLLTPEEAARELKVSAEQVRALIRKGRLPAVNLGTGKKRPLYRITRQDLEDFLMHRYQPQRGRPHRRFRRLPPVEDHFPKLR